jgi:hypothetical protein
MLIASLMKKTGGNTAQFRPTRQIDRYTQLVPRSPFRSDSLRRYSLEATVERYRPLWRNAHLQGLLPFDISIEVLTVGERPQEKGESYVLTSDLPDREQQRWQERRFSIARDKKQATSG